MNCHATTFFHFYFLVCYSKLTPQEIDKKSSFNYVNVLYTSSMSSGEMKDGKHCHDNSHALEDREREKKLAKKRLYIVSAVCLVFMVGEILGV